MRVPRAVPSLLLVALSTSCNKDFPNPFEDREHTVPPSADAGLIYITNAYAPRPGAGREVFAVADNGANPTRLTFCDREGRPCETLEAAAAAERNRIVVRRILRDADTDGRLGPGDGESLVALDLARSVEGTLLPQTARVSGVDWSPTAEILVFSSTVAGGTEDLFRTDSNGQNSRNITSTPSVRERRPRIDPTGNVAVFERIGETGKGEVWIFQNSAAQFRVTQGGPGDEALPGTPYVVGADADPDYAPDGRTIVFRRLTSPGADGRGTWDLFTIRIDVQSATPVPIVSGPRYRGAPDWGPKGIVFPETDPDTGTTSLVVVQGDGSGRGSVLTVGAGFALDFPRWLR